jgi:hypothetical protein
VGRKEYSLKHILKQLRSSLVYLFNLFRWVQKPKQLLKTGGRAHYGKFTFHGEEEAVMLLKKE